MGTASATAKLLANTGLTGSEAGKLLKTMSLINGNSIETNVNTLLAKDNLAEAAGLRTANVLKQIAGDTDMFARAGERGADALFRAAMAAEKMGIELSKFDSLADNLLDVESVLNNQFRLSAMLGQNIDLSRSMRLAQQNDLAGLQAETANLVRQIGVGNIQSMGRAQQNLLKQTLGAGQFSITDLMKLGTGTPIDAGDGTPPVAKDTLSAANKSNELSVEHHKEQMGALQKLQDQNVELIKATKDMGS